LGDEKGPGAIICLLYVLGLSAVADAYFDKVGTESRDGNNDGIGPGAVCR
jgi:hypothetical protein